MPTARPSILEFLRRINLEISSDSPTRRMRIHRDLSSIRLQARAKWRERKNTNCCATHLPTASFGKRVNLPVPSAPRRRSKGPYAPIPAPPLVLSIPTAVRSVFFLVFFFNRPRSPLQQHCGKAAWIYGALYFSIREMRVYLYNISKKYALSVVGMHT